MQHHFILCLITIGLLTFNLFSASAQRPSSRNWANESQQEPETKPLPPPPAQPTTPLPEAEGAKPKVQAPTSAPQSTSDKKNNAPKSTTAAGTKSEKKADVPEIGYTFATDRRYDNIHEINNEIFFPAKYQMGQGSTTTILPGDISIRILEQFIEITGVKDLPPRIQLLSKSVSKVGFIYELMDSKGQPARLKIVVDQDKFVNLIYFNSKSLGEHTFFLAEKAPEDRAADLNFFTPQKELFVRAYQNLLDKTIKPYALIEDYTLSNNMKMLKPTNNISIGFKETGVSTPAGTFEIKKADTYMYKLDGFPNVASVIEIVTKGKPGKIYVFINYMQNIELIQVENTRYFLMP